MIPIFFGTRARRLFGVYHPATSRPPKRSGVVICPPAFLEMSRTRRALRQLAVELADRGFHVLRFDYHGTGDSGGTGEDETVEGWIQDARLAMDELRDLAGIRRSTLVGVRFGGAVASEAAARSGALEGLVLWSPIVSGASYYRWILDRAGVPRGLRGRATTDATGIEGSVPGGRRVLGVDGFPVGSRLLREIALGGVGRTNLRDLRQISLVDVPSSQAAVLLARQLDRDGVPLEVRSVPDEAAWEDPDRQGHVVVAPRAIAEITASITAAAA